jgi:hypothetical protein
MRLRRMTFWLRFCWAPRGATQEASLRDCSTIHHGGLLSSRWKRAALRGAPYGFPRRSRCTPWSGGTSGPREVHWLKPILAIEHRTSDEGDNSCACPAGATTDNGCTLSAPEMHVHVWWHAHNKTPPPPPPPCTPASECQGHSGVLAIIYYYYFAGFEAVCKDWSTVSDCDCFSDPYPFGRIGCPRTITYPNCTNFLGQWICPW